MATSGFTSLSVGAADTNTNVFFNLLNERYTTLSWAELDENLSPLNLFTHHNRKLLDILHVYFDGHTIAFEDDKMIQEKWFNLSKPLVKRLDKNKDLWEITRSGTAFQFIKQGLGTPSDYMHFLKLHAINHGSMPKKEIPKHLKKLIETDYYKSRADTIDSVAAEITYKILQNKNNVHLKKLIPNYRQSESGLGANYDDPLLYPDYINQAMKIIIDGGQTKKEVFKMLNVKERTFYRHWDKYKYQAFKEYLFDTYYMHKEEEQDSRIKEVEVPQPAENLHDIEWSDFRTLNIEITFTPRQLKDIKKAMDLKHIDLPNKIVLQEYAELH